MISLKVGLIGVGTIGRQIAPLILKGGFDLVAYDLRQEAVDELVALGASSGESVRDVAAAADVVELWLSSDAQVEDVVLGRDGVLAGAKPGTVVAIHTSIQPKTAVRLYGAGKERGIGIVDAPVNWSRATLSLGLAAGADRRVCYMVGGEAPDVETCRPVFEASASEIFHVGEAGRGAACKLALQLIYCINALSASEGMRLAEKAGVSPDTLKAVADDTAAYSGLVANWRPVRQVGGEGAEAGRHLVDLFWGVLDSAIELGHDLGVPLPGTALAQQLLARTMGLQD